MNLNIIRYSPVRSYSKELKPVVPNHIAPPTSPATPKPKPLIWGYTDWLLVLVLLLLVLLFHWRLLTPTLADQQSYLPGDFTAQFWAFSTFEARMLGQGELPLWNPYTYAGAPFWADVQSAVFYPFSLLTLGISALFGGFNLFALEVEAILHFWLAACFMYLFARRVTAGRGSGFVAALIFTFGGYLTGYPAQQLAVLEVDVWLPLILWFVDRALVDRQTTLAPQFRATPQPGNLIGAGLAWGLAILAGHPQSWMLVAYTFTTYFLFLRWQYAPRPIQLIKKSASLFLIILIGLGLAAIQFIPATEYTLLSVRATGVYDKMAGGFPLTDLLQIIFPGLVSHYSPLYIGLVGLLLVIYVLFYGRNRFTIFWGGWGGLALLISFGGNTFLYAPLYLAVPGFSIFRGQERWALIVAFSAAILAGYGWCRLSQQIGVPLSANPKMKSPSFNQILQWAVWGAIALVILFFYGLNQTGWSAESQFYQLLNQSVFMLIIISLFGMVVRFMPPLTVAWSAWPVALVSSLLIFDLFSVNWQTNLFPQPPEWHTQKPAIVAALEADVATSSNIFRVYNEFRMYDNYGVPFGIQDLWGASPLRLARYDAFLAPPMRLERAWELLNVKYVITWRQELYVPSTIIYQEAAPDGTTYLHRLETVGPRAWLVQQIEPISAEEMIPRLTDPAFAVAQTALVDPADFPDVTLDSVMEEADLTPNGQVNLHTFQPNHLTFEVMVPHDAFLVISEIDYPGWRAEVDGVTIPLVRTNYILRGLPLKAGSHQLELTFRPRSFQVGAIISLLTLVGVVIFGVIKREYERD